MSVCQDALATAGRSVGGCVLPLVTLESDCDTGYILSVMVWKGHRKPDKVWKASLSGSQETGWLVQTCLGSSQPDLEAGVGTRTAEVLAGAHPWNCGDLLREGKATQATGETSARARPAVLGKFPGQPWPGSGTAGWERSVEHRQPCSHCHCVYHPAVPGQREARGLWRGQLDSTGHTRPHSAP